MFYLCNGKGIYDTLLIMEENKIWDSKMKV